MLHNVSKAAAGRPLLAAQPHLWPALGTASSRLLLPTLVAKGIGSSCAAQQQHRGGGSDGTAAARQAAQDLGQAAQDSAKHAAEGDVGSAMHDAMRMAQAGARGAAESARPVFEKMIVLHVGVGHQGADSAASDAGTHVANNLAQGASAAYTQTVGSMTGTSTPSGFKGPESTYKKNVLQDARVRLVGSTATGDWAGVMVQSAADESGGGGGGGGAVGGEDVGASPKGSGAGGAGFAGPSGGAAGAKGMGEDCPGGASEKSFADDEFALGGGSSQEGGKHGASGGGGSGQVGGAVSERSAKDDEFGVTKE